MERLVEHANAVFAIVVALQLALVLVPTFLYFRLSRKKQAFRLGMLLGALHLGLMAAIALAAANMKDDTICWIGLCVLDLPVTFLFHRVEHAMSMIVFFLLFGTAQYFLFGWILGAVYGRVRRWRMSRAAVLAVALVAGGSAHAAGVCAHAEMGQRAWDAYLVSEDEILPGIAAFRSDDDVMRAFYSGCCFPDFAYDGINQDASEYSHWYPYVNAYMEYLQAHYPPPWDHEAMRHVAFFLGHLCHNVGDWPWHFNDGENKSITSAFVERYGLDVDDFASDIFAHTIYTIHPSLQGRFWWPQEDAFAAFQKDHVKVTRDEVARGCVKMEGEWRKGATFGPIVYPAFQWKYRWFRDHMEDYYFGGIDHDAALIAQCLRYAYARLQGWRFYQNISLHDILFPDKKPFLPFEPTPPIMDLSQNDAVTLRVDLSDLKTPEEVHEASLWLRTIPNERTDAKPCAVRIVAEGIEGCSASAEIGAAERRGAWIKWDIAEMARKWAAVPSSNQGMVLSLEGGAGADTPRFYGTTAFREGTGETGGRLIAYRPILVVR